MGREEQPTRVLWAAALAFLFLAPAHAAESEPLGPIEARAPAVNASTLCARDLSRQARYVLTEYFLPAAEKAHYEWPPDCPLTPANDMLRAQEDAKRQLHRAQWRCLLCGKQFFSEHYIDQHMDNRHAAHGIVATVAACLGDLCETLHCAAGQLHLTRRRRTACTVSAAAMRRASCEALAVACFPPAARPPAAALGGLFRAQFCDAHSCGAERALPFALGRQGPGVLAPLRTILAWLLIVAGAAYYGCLGCAWGRRRATGDLRRTHPGAAEGAWGGFIRKQKDY